MSVVVRYILLAAMSAALVLGTGEWTEDAEDLETNNVPTVNPVKVIDKNNVTDELKYILKWTHKGNQIPYIFKYMGDGQRGFIDNRCPYRNCFVTDDKSFLEDYTKFDLILFNGFPKSDQLPKKRSPYQKYAFGSMESGDNYPVCNESFNDFFNWTFTYKTDADVKWMYLTIRDKEKNVIGPNKDIKWLKVNDMKPISKELKDKLKKKSKAAAWFVTNCNSRNKREKYVQKLQKALKSYNLTVDVYGKCGPLKCPRNNEELCRKKVRDEYYFYLSFENSFAEDYVTEKLLTALQNYAIPIVYGAADYDRFLPEGVYLNARKLGVEKLAKTMNELIQNPDRYYNYFRWQNHYVYEHHDRNVDENGYCAVCTLLNNKTLVNESSSYKNFSEWWTPSDRC